MEVAGDALSISLSGGATIKAIGTVTQLSLTAASGGQAQLEELAVTNATVTMSGGSQATLNVTGALGGTAADGATIHLKVKPGTQNVKTTGGAVVVGG
jgi:predicted DNA-binding protein with PD1-like motif